VKCLVLGAKGSIGSACVDSFKGADVELFEQDRTGVYKNGCKILGASDLEDIDALRSLVNLCILQKINTVVIATGLYGLRPDNFEQAFEYSNRTMRVNAIAPLHFTEELLRLYGSNKCTHALHVMALSSVTTKHLGGIDTVSYTVSKGAIEMGFRALSKHYASESVRLNILRVGVVDNHIHENANKNMQMRKALIPSRRFLEPSELGDAVRDLCCQSSFSYLSGATMDLCGGE
jgi:NAD(P)-dependent dehydrogenase (short-subunit alcohol dehydrogenase family)